MGVKNFLMKAEEFIKKLTDIMDTDAQLTLETKLSDVEEWDSLSMVSFFSFCNARSKSPILPDAIKNAVTVNDLYKIIGDIQ